MSLGIRITSPPKSTKAWRHAAHRKRATRPSVAARRALRAVTLIVAVTATLAVASLMTAEHPTAPTLANRSLSEAVLDSIRTGGDVVAEDEALPLWFEEEFFSVGEYFDLHCNAEGTVISVMSALPAQATLTRIEGEMEAKGWTAIGSGSVTMMTMVRTEGSHRWALLWSQAMGGQSTIVVQTLPCE